MDLLCVAHGLLD
jgi:uncharacterized OsmC-like protein